jgi:opacity protein-like surface antigen
MTRIFSLITAILFTFCTIVSAQEDDLLSLLGEEETTDYTNASFKTNRVINLHSLENTAAGVLDFKINHRFSPVSNGFYDLFGLDGANIRFGLDYGLSDVLTVGVGRSSLEKTYDGFVKYKFLRQSTGKKTMPLTAALLLTSSINTLKWENPDRENYFSSRLAYTTQLILGRKFSESFSLQLSPTMVHRNLVKTNAEKNDVYALGIGSRLKLSKRVAINAEYIYVLPDQLSSEFYNSLSVGLDIETGGHVFQLHFSNSRSMVERGFITETNSQWNSALDGVRFGFNISRVFTLKRKKLE